MLILHTSDWHLGARTGGIDRLDDAFDRIDELMAVIDERQADVLLIAGDVFDEARADRLPAIFSRLGRVLGPRVADGLSVVALAGNHDREHVFPLLRTAKALLAAAGDRVTFTERPRLVPVTNRAGTEQIQIACLPYPTPSRYDLEATSWASREAKHAELAAAMRRAINDLAEEAARDRPGIQAIASGHFYVRGVAAHLYCMTEAEDIPIERGDLPGYAYVALGHIHKGQDLGSDAIRYCGSIERMDRGEAGDDKSVLLVTLDGPRLTSVEPVPLNATPFATVDASCEADVDAAHDAMTDPDRTMVSLRVVVEATTSVSAVVARARALFPRLYGAPEIRRTGPAQTTRPGAQTVEAQDVAGTVRAYLDANLAGDPDREPVMALAEHLLAADAA